MDKVKNSGLFRIIALVLVITFISLDIAYAYPPEHNPSNSTLATPSLMQQPIDDHAARFQQSVFSQGALLASIYDIGEYFFGRPEKETEPLPSKYAEEVVRAGLGKILGDSGIEILNIVPVEYLKKTVPEKLQSSLGEIGFKGALPDEGVVFILYRKDGKKFLVQIAEKRKVAPENLPGYEWTVSDKYVVKYIPEDYEGGKLQSSAPQASVSEKPGSSDMTAKRPTSPAQGIELKKINTPPAAVRSIEPISAAIVTLGVVSWLKDFSVAHMAIAVIIAAVLAAGFILWRTSLSRQARQMVTIDIPDGLKEEVGVLRGKKIMIMASQNMPHAKTVLNTLRTVFKQYGAIAVDKILDADAVIFITELKGEIKFSVGGKGPIARASRTEAASKPEELTQSVLTATCDLLKKSAVKESPRKSPKAYSLEPFSIIFGAAWIWWIFSAMQNAAIAHPVLAGIIALGVGTVVFFSVWRIFFPVSWNLWRLKRLNDDIRSKDAKAAMTAEKPLFEFSIGIPQELMDKLTKATKELEGRRLAWEKTSVKKPEPASEKPGSSDMTAKTPAEGRPKFQAKTKILCACNWNYNRSPVMEMVIAELIDRNGLGSVMEVSSGAVGEANKDGWNGQNKEAIDAFLTVYGKETARRVYSKSLTREQVAQADVIIVPSAKTKEAIIARFSAIATGKKFILLDEYMNSVEKTPYAPKSAEELVYKTKAVIEGQLWQTIAPAVEGIAEAGVEVPVAAGSFAALTSIKEAVKLELSYIKELDPASPEMVREIAKTLEWIMNSVADEARGRIANDVKTPMPSYENIARAIIHNAKDKDDIAWRINGFRHAITIANNRQHVGYQVWTDIPDIATTDYVYAYYTEEEFPGHENEGLTDPVFGPFIRATLGISIKYLRNLGIAVETDKDSIEILIDELNYGSYADQIDAIEEAAEVTDQRIIEPLINAISRHMLSIRIGDRAVEAVSKFGKAATPVLMKVLTDPAHFIMPRWVIAEALGKIKDPDTVEPLIEALDNKESGISSPAAFALGKIGDIRAVEPLIKASGNTSWGGRHNAVRALGELKDARAVEPLISLLGDDAGDVRYYALTALYAIGDPRTRHLNKSTEEMVRHNEKWNFEYSMVGRLSREEIDLLLDCVRKGTEFETQYVPAVLHWEGEIGTGDESLITDAEGILRVAAGRKSAAFALDKASLMSVARRFRSDLEGRGTKGSSISDIVTKIGIPTGREKGRYLFIDLGGTNLRVGLVQFNGDRTLEKKDELATPVPQGIVTGGGNTLFEFIAGTIKAFAEEHKLSGELKIGFTFSFAMKKEGVDRGIITPECNVKGYNFDKVMGEEIVTLLNRELAKIGLANVNIVALVNDTEGVRDTGAYLNGATIAGGVFGTGHNTAIRDASGGSVNLESGAFDKLATDSESHEVASLDGELDALSSNPGVHPLEKRLSGKYVGPLFGLKLERELRGNRLFANHKAAIPAIFTDHNYEKEGYHGFSGRHLSEIEDRWLSGGINALKDYIKALGIHDPTDEDAKRLRSIAHDIMLRSAQLGAATFAGIIMQREQTETPKGKYAYALDGSLLHYPGYIGMMKTALSDIFGKEYASLIEIFEAKDGSGIGAAITAMIVSTQAPGAGVPKAEKTNKTTPLFEIVESAIVGKRAEFIKAGNVLVGSLDNNLTTAEIKQKVERAISAIDSMRAEDISPEARAAIASLKENLGQLEADGMIASLIAMARRAKKEEQKLIIGLETEWIPAITNKNSLQRNAITALMKEIDSIGDALRSMGLDNVEIIRGSSSRLATSILIEAGKTHTRMHNIVVMASSGTINSDSFAILRNTSEDDRPFLAGIDPSELVKLYDQYGESVSKQLYVRLTGLLCLTLELAAGKEPPQTPMIVSYDRKLRIVIFLPSAEPMDYQLLYNTYKAEKAVLHAA